MKISSIRKTQDKNFKFQISNSKGFSIIEVILATSIFMILAAGSLTVVLQGLSSNRLGEEKTVATQYASEGIEAIRSIKNRGFSNLVNTTPTSGLIQSGGVWTLNGLQNQFGPPPGNNKYTRTLAISDAQRDCSGNIVASGGSVDPLTKKVTSTVSWNFTPTRLNSIQQISYLSDWRKPIDPTKGPIIMAYSKTTTIPYYRIWDGSSWSAESPARAVGGNINYIVLKSSRTRNEAILGTMGSNGNIYVQVWDGRCWGTPTLIANVGAGLSAYRSFDITYEQNNDRAMIVYLPNSTSADPAYRIWNGTNWSSPTTITTPPTTGVVRWIDVTQNPINTSNEIAMILLDANTDVYGMAWNGSSWGTMGDSFVWDASASNATRKGVDVTYEQISGRAMFIWGDSVATDQRYRIWNGTSLTAAALLDIPASGGVVNWTEMASRPNSNEIMLGVQDAGSDLNTRKWSGSAWDTATQHPEHDASVESITSINFDVVWETHSSNPGRAWILWGAGTNVSKRQWSGSAWGSATTLTGSDDTSLIKLKADPASGAVFAQIYENSTSATDDIWESRLTGGSATWSSKNSIWGGPTSANPVYFRMDIATP